MGSAPQTAFFVVGFNSEKSYRRNAESPVRHDAEMLISIKV